MDLTVYKKSPSHLTVYKQFTTIHWLVCRVCKRANETRHKCDYYHLSECNGLQRILGPSYRLQTVYNVSLARLQRPYSNALDSDCCARASCIVPCASCVGRRVLSIVRSCIVRLASCVVSSASCFVRRASCFMRRRASS